MDVRTGGTATDTSVADDFTATDVGTGHNGKRRKVRVESGDAETVLDDHETSVAGMSFRGGNDAVGSYVDRLAIFGTDVNASVERTFTRERIQTFAETIRDMTHDGPDRRSVIGIGKRHCRQQAEAGSRNSDRTGIALEEGILFQGTIKGVLRRGFVIGLIERGRMIAEDAVGHGHVGGEGLQRIEALVGVFNGGLEIAVLLL